MSRLLLAVAGIILVLLLALAALWLAAQLVVGLGLFVVSVAAVLLKLLWFLVLAGLLSGVVYFVASAWRPAVPVQPQRQPLVPNAPAVAVQTEAIQSTVEPHE